MKVHGDSELMVNQVRNLNVVKNDTLKKYKYRVLDLIEDVVAFNFLDIPRVNKHVDRLATLGAQFDIPKDVHNVERQHYVKVVVRPSVLDNNLSWKLFDNDE